MWQKLNRLDVVSLERARIQISNILQLVSAAPRCFGANKGNKHPDWLHWDGESTSFVSNKFGKNNRINVSLDIEKLILSINGDSNQREHLVLSGMTYPMAYGWMSIKLNTFQLDGSLFNDVTDYTLEAYLKPDAEISAEDQVTYDKLVMYYGNADYLFAKLTDKLKLDGTTLIDPSNGNLVFTSRVSRMPELGFSIGNRSYPEPYFFIKVSKERAKKMANKEEFMGIWDNNNSEFVLMASDFLTQNPDQEFLQVMEFFTSNLSKLVKT